MREIDMGEVVLLRDQQENEGTAFGAFSGCPIAIPASILLWAVIIGIGYLGWNYFIG